MAKDGRAELIAGLNEDLANEYAAIISYLLFSRMVTGPHRLDLSSYLEGEIADELEHAKMLSHKIVALGGTPTTQPAEITLSTSNREMLEFALQSEKDTIARYTQRIKQADAVGDIALKVELENLIAEESHHRDELERILSGWHDE